jgi:DNA-binding PucR family transcriptional regulator
VCVRAAESIETPAEQTPAEQIPAEQAPAEQTPVLSTPVEPPKGRAGQEASAEPEREREAEPSRHELLASVPTPVLRSFSDRLLAPVREYDGRRNAELLATLESFLACDGSWSACASQMYVHVNTVRYRISRIEALTGRDLSALADRVDFFLALHPS